MALINELIVSILTGDFKNAGTDDRVYLGICGREFRLDNSKNNYKRNGQDYFSLGGNDPNIKNKNRNDPREPAIDSDDLGVYPKYIRFEGKEWNLMFANVDVAVVGSVSTSFLFESVPDGIWLGHKYGKIIHLIERRWRTLSDKP